MSHAAIRCRRSWPSGDSRYVIRSESIKLIVFSSRTRQGYQRNPSASTMMEEVSQPWSHVIRLKYPSGEMMTPGYFFFISSPTRDMDQRSGRWSFVFFRWTAHMTTALTSSVGMSIHLFFTCQQLQNEQVKLQRRVSLKEQ